MNIEYKYNDTLEGYQTFTNEKYVGLLKRPAGMNYYWWMDNGIEDFMLGETFESSKAILEKRIISILEFSKRIS